MPSASNRQTVIALVAIILGMVMLVSSAPSLYRLFCQVTGFAGTTRRASGDFAAAVSSQTMNVRFNANMDPALPWSFAPIEKQVTVHLGENRLVAFKVVNESGSDTLGTATYNVTPNLAGKYFNKIQCFCFTKQHVGPHEEVTMPVSFFIDPAIADDPELKGLTNITLSYTFFSYDSRNQAK